MKPLKPFETIWNRLKDFIRRGIIRIFPLPFTFRQAVIVIVIVIVGGTLLGCSSTRHVTQLVRDVRTDTIYLNRQQYDSIYIYQERNVFPLPDSIHLPFNGEDGRGLFIKDVCVEYRYKLLRDTVRIVQRDSIPYEVTITETKEITRPLTFFDKLCRSCFWFLIGLIGFAVLRCIKPLTP